MPEFDSPAAMTEISSMDGEQLSVRVPLLPGWDASLTYDLLDDPNESIPKGIFVGRGTLLGPLVNALAQPHQRGTYLISGYRGVGKTSLIIEAMLRARGELENRDWSLLPIVLNVSEVSASLSSASDAEQVELAIDARKLLTALLRAIRNHLSREEERRLPPVDGKATSTDARKLLTARLRALRKRFSRQEQPRPPSIADKVMSTYRKAESTRFTYTQTQRTEALVTVAKEKTRAFQVADVMKLLGAGLLLAAIVAEGTVWLGAIDQFHAAAVALAGLAVLSFGSSRVMKQTKSNTDADTFELVFDNSLHQLESELKDILEDLNKEKRRTVIVLEELDKIDDDQGRQLESVIRYFKNLFTQAPALFFFVTDKYYYDAVGNRIDAERAKGSYAIEHTFFTHRIFVVRPGIEECLSYLREIFVADQAVAEVDLIARFSESRSRPIADMSPLEKCLRVLLFRSQGHFFDLKNQLRQFVRVDGEQATLVFDDALMSQSEQALAAFQFLVEQKMHTYRFGGGRDYANEALRSCLFAVFDQMGSQQGRDIGSLYPAEGYIGERLSLSERSRIIEALDTLVEDLERGKSLERHQEEVWKFTWNKTDPAMLFAPVVRLAPHEQTLAAELSRMSATARAWGTGKRLRRLLPSEDTAIAAVRLSEELSRQSHAISNSQAAMPSEEADRQRATAHKRVAELIEPLVIAHVSEIAKDSSVSLEPLSRATPPLLYRVQWTPESDQSALLVYSTFGPVPSDFRKLERQLVDRVAVVQVISDIDDRAYDASGTDPLMDSLRAIGLRERHVVRMRLDEDMENQRQPPSWGWRALDELHLALLWLDQPTTVNLPRQLESQLSQEYTLLTSGNDPRMMTLLDAARAWLDEGHQTLLRAASLAPSEEALCAAVRQRGPVILSSNGDHVNGEEFLRSGSLTRLFASGKVIVADHLGQWGSDTPLLSAGSSAGGRSVVTFDLEDHYDPFYERAEAAAIHPTVVGVQSVRLARVLLSGYYDHAVSLLTAAAESGDSEAAAELAVVSAQQNRQESRRWQAKLIESGSLNDMNSAGDRLQELDMDGAITLYRAAAEAGDVSARTSLAVVLAPKDKEESRQWQAKLIESGSSIAMNSAGDRLQELDMDGAITLYRAAAEAGDVSARTSLAVVLAPKNKEESRHWQAKLIESGSSIAMNSAGDRLQEVDVDGAMSLYRTAAEEGNTAAMTSLAVMLAPKDKEESRGWQAKLMESGSTAAMDSAGDRLQEVDLDGAMSLYRTAADAGNTAAMTSLAVMLAPKDKEESRGWQAKLMESGSTAAMDIAGDRLQEVDPDGAITLYQAAAEAGDSYAKRSLKAMLQSRKVEADPASGED